jgi:integrase
MQRIIDRWGNEPQPDNHIFDLVEHTDNPQLAMDRKKWFTKNFNQHLKMIAVAVGLDNPTSYTARHSYATVLKWISQLSPHKKLSRYFGVPNLARTKS